MDYFEFFELPRKLTLDVVALEKQFYTMSRRLHPDRFASKPVAEQEAALAQSSLLNDAYRTLKDPILRTQYLLAYYPSERFSDSNFRKIEVKVDSVAGVNVRHRTGYYTTKSKF